MELGNVSVPLNVSAAAVEEAYYPTWFVVVLWLLALLMSLETILGNLLVLLAYRLDHHIQRHLSNQFLISLAVSDLIIGLEGFPLLTVYVSQGQKWPLGELACQVWLTLDYTLCLVSILTVLLITVDRYGSVVYPAKYLQWQSERKIRWMIGLSWVVPALLFGALIFGWSPLTGQSASNPTDCYAPFLNDPYLNMSMYIVYYWSVLVAMLILYRGIATTARALELKGDAREKRNLAILMGQRCMTQVGVGLLLQGPIGAMAGIKERADEKQTQVEEEGKTTVVGQAPPSSGLPSNGQLTTVPPDSGYVTADVVTATVESHHCLSPPLHCPLPSAFTKSSLTPKESLASGDTEDNASLLSGAYGDLSLGSVLTLRVGEGGKVFTQSSRNSSLHSRHHSSRRRWARKRSSLPVSEANTPSGGSTPAAPQSRLSSGHPRLRLIPRAATLDDDGDGPPQPRLHAAVPRHIPAHPPLIPLASEEPGLSDSLYNIRASASKFDLKHWPISEEPSSLVLPTPASASPHPKSLAARPWASLRNSPSPASPRPSPPPSPPNSSPPLTPQPARALPPKDPLSSLSSASSQSSSENLAQSRDPQGPQLKDKDSLAGIEEIQDIHDQQSPTALLPPASAPAPSKAPQASPPKLHKSSKKKSPVPKRYRKRRKSSHGKSKSSTTMTSGTSSDSDTVTGPGDDSESGGDEEKVEGAEEDTSPSSLPKADRRRKNALISILNPSFLLPKRRKKTKAEKRARKAFRTITIIVGAFAIFWSPYYIVATIYGFCADCVPSTIFLTSYYLCYLNSSGNPFAYALANRQFRNAFIRIFKGDLRRFA